jgi:TetR/AcrR family transcriptional regulator, mexJK operon transcriptional repressor
MEALTKPKPARPGPDERRIAILKTAHAVFLADGYAATSMSTIAARLGGSKATLYNYFASKEELFVAVVEQKCEQFRAIAQDAQEDHDDFPVALHRLGMRLLNLILSEESVATYRMIIAESGRFPELGRIFFETGSRQGMDSVAGFLRQAMDAGHLQAGDPLFMGQVFFELSMGELHKRRLFNVKPEPSKEEIRRNVERAVSIFFKVFGKDPDV